MTVKGLTRMKLAHSEAALFKQNRFRLSLDAREDVVLFNDGQQPETRRPRV